MMDRLFGVPTQLLALTAAVALAVVLAGVGVLAWRRPLLVRLGLRAAVRRPLRGALIIVGLATSTAVIAAAIGTGETMAGTIRAAVAGGIGPVDVVLTAGTRTPSAPGIRDPRSVLAGSELAAGQLFPLAVYDRLVAATAGDPDIAALEPALQTQATAINPAQGRARTGVKILGLRPGAPVFDRFRDDAGGHIGIAGLAPEEVLINAEAGRLLEVSPGDEVLLTFADGRTATRRVRAVVQDGGLAGLQAAVIAPLAGVQALLGKPDQINQILVSVKDDGDFAARSRAATGRLRLALADPNALAQVARALATDEGQSQLRALESRAQPEARPAIARLRRVARSGRVTPDLAYYLADPALTSNYYWIVGNLGGDTAVRGRDLTRELAPLTVLEVKQRAIDAANEYGSAVITVFLILGLFSIAASLLLVFLIFVMLAAERRTEMGMMRAVGAQRRHLIAAFAVEGLAYDLAASALGLGLGVGVGLVVLRLLQRVLDRFDVVARGHMSVGGLALSFCLGVLVTFASVMLAAWKVSRVNIVAAVHGAPDAAPRARGAARRQALRALWAPVPAAAGIGLIVTARGAGLQLAAGGALALLALAWAARSAAVALGAPRAAVDRGVATVMGPAIALVFALSAAAPESVRSDGVIRSGTLGFVVAGVVMALALVWAAGYNLTVLLWPVVQLSRLGGLAPAVRMAVAYPRTHPFRTALTAAMFALVVLTMVAATALLRSTEAAYVARDGGAGFDVRAQFTTPPGDLPDALAHSTTVRRDDFTAIGAQAVSPAEALWPEERMAMWRPVEVRVADDGLLSASSGQLLARAAGFTSDASVWRAVRDQPGAAIVSRRELGNLPSVQARIVARASASPTFDPQPVWVRDPRGGPAHKLTIIGVTADGTILPSGILTSQAALAGSPAAVQPPAEYFLRTREDVSYQDAATGVQLTFPENGVRTRVLGEEARTVEAIRRLLDTLIRGFLSMGLASGLAALGVIGMRSVAERRQQIGMLRALGFSRRAVQATFLIEGSVVAILGITVGGVVGLALARNVVTFLGRDFTQLQLIVPWGQVAALAGAAYGAALLSAVIVAWQAGRVTPAEALRYE
jgi:putative ABC transport system permease protein